MSEGTPKTLTTKLDDQHQRFALEYFSGEHAGNGTQSYLAVNPKVKESTAASAASDLLKNNKVKALLTALHEEAREGVVAEMKPWLELAPMAQNVLELTCRGKLRSRPCLDSAKEILYFSLGKPTERVEHLNTNASRITRSLYALGVRKTREG